MQVLQKKTKRMLKSIDTGKPTTTIHGLISVVEIISYRYLGAHRFSGRSLFSDPAEHLCMNSMQTCNFVTFYFMKKLIF